MVVVAELGIFTENSLNCTHKKGEFYMENMSH